jgi:hypothetical protein
MNLVVDVAYAYVDPRIHSKYMSVRKQQKKETKAAKEVA